MAISGITKLARFWNFVLGPTSYIWAWKFYSKCWKILYYTELKFIEC